MKETRGGLTVAWKVAALSSDIASVRYRALLPVLALEAAGVRHRLFDDADEERLEGVDALVIVKSFTKGDLELAHAAAERGIPVIFDLCDNIFIGAYGGESRVKVRPVGVLQAMASHLAAIVVTTEPLAKVTRAALGFGVPVHVVPDGVESADLVREAEALLAAARRSGSRVRRLRRRVRQRLVGLRRRATVLRAANFRALVRKCALRCRAGLHWRFWAKRAYRRYDAVRTVWRQHGKQRAAAVVPTQATLTDSAPAQTHEHRILWFGNHGAEHARFGMLDLLDVRQALETIAAEFDVELVVVSNHREKYLKHIHPLAIPSRYVEWSPAAMERAFESADVVIVPNSGDEFSLCKSANRTVLALTHGVPVVATLTPALEVLRDCIEHGDFAAGLRKYLTDPAHGERHVAAGRERVEQQFGPGAIAEAWLRVLQQAGRAAPEAATPSELIVLLHLAQDIDLAAPVIAAAKACGVALEVWYSSSLLDKSPRSMVVLQALGVRSRAWPESVVEDGSVRFPPSARALLTVAETNLRPHEFTRRITEAANKAGLATATLQHGFENVGLTYSDDVHAIGKVDFAAQRIYLWGTLDTLHPAVPSPTRKKCLAVGCPKPVAGRASLPEGLLPAGRPVIGVFENLHWHRYDDDYRMFFIEGVRRVAAAFPQLLFLVKPHHAGMWLTARFDGEAPVADNLIVADPQTAEWEAYTAPSLLGHLQAVITTPSTVALDAARCGLPTAVVAAGLQLENYQPLRLIEAAEDWTGFISSVLDVAQRQQLAANAQEFAQRSLVAGDVTLRILRDLLNRDDLSLSGKEA